MKRSSVFVLMVSLLFVCIYLHGQELREDKLSLGQTELCQLEQLRNGDLQIQHILHGADRNNYAYADWVYNHYENRIHGGYQWQPIDISYNFKIRISYY